MLKLVSQKLNISVPPDNKNSGQTLAALIAEKANPVADIAYFGGQFGPQARAADVLTPFKPARFGEIPAGMKDPDGYWFTIHSGTLGLFINTAALRGKPVPQSWRDLLKPEYKGLIGYLNPASAAVGQVGVIAVNLALGGSYENLDPGIAFFKQLQANQPIVPTQTSYARVLSGEIPILFDYDFNAYRAKYKDNAPVTFVIPAEGSQQLPYIMGLVAKGPNPEQGKKILDFLLSDDGQRHWASAFLRPVFASALTPEMKSRFLPDSDYARAKPLDVFKLSAASKTIGERYQKEVG
jgi:putative spermidine/putrescine transport system substrate-binding protein